MPLIITQGYGSEGALALFEVALITPSASYIDIQFSADISPLTLQAALTSYWTFTSGSGIQIFATSVQIQSPDTIRVGITKATNGATYTLTLPLNGLNSVLGDSYDGAAGVDFVAVANPLTVISVLPLDGQLVQVQFSDSVVKLEALDLGNYSFSPALLILDIKESMSSIYILTTAAQTPGTSYDLTITGIHDLYGNGF